VRTSVQESITVVLEKTPATILRPILVVLMEQSFTIGKLIWVNAAPQMFHLVHQILIQTADSVLRLGARKEPNVVQNSV